MQTARVTILMTPDKKAAFDTLAAERGISTGEFFRRAGDQQTIVQDSEEAATLALAIDELEKSLPGMQDDLEAIRASIAVARKAIADALRPSVAMSATCEAA